MNGRKLHLIGFIILLFLQNGFAQRQSALVPPQTTDPNINTNLNNHYVSINRGVTPKGQLVVFFPGTGGVGANQREFNHTAADLGFHAVNLTYPNDEPVNGLCGGSNFDLDCYGNVRLEIKDGTNRSSLVNVNRANSIENRLIKLLIYLQNQAPNDDWAQFLVNNSEINWSRVIVAGHSQGGGHAGIIGRYHSVVRVLMFSAMDFSGIRNAPANWIALPETTPNASSVEKFWGFSHQRDESINFTQLSTRVWPAYGMPQFGQIVNVDQNVPPFGNTHSLSTDTECGNFHGCVVVDARLVYVDGVPVFKPVWEYLLSGTLSPLDLGEIRFSKAGQIVGRPSVGVTTKPYRIVITGSGFDVNSTLLVNGAAINTEFISSSELRGKLPPGPFGRFGGSNVQVRNSNGLVSNTRSY